MGGSNCHEADERAAWVKRTIRWVVLFLIQRAAALSLMHLPLYICLAASFTTRHIYTLRAREIRLPENRLSFADFPLDSANSLPV